VNQGQLVDPFTLFLYLLERTFRDNNWYSRIILFYESRYTRGSGQKRTWTEVEQEDCQEGKNQSGFTGARESEWQ